MLRSNLKALGPSPGLETRAARIDIFGGPDVVTTDITTMRDPGPNEVVVRVAAAGANPLDVKIIAGHMREIFPMELPYTPGTDFSGTVEVGTPVNGPHSGDRVFGRTVPNAGGAFADRLVIAADKLCVVPDSMSFVQAAALPTTFGTARQALFEAGSLRAGERVLIHAGAGGVGTMAIQQAHRAGAHVIAAASARNHDLLQALGADEVVDYRSQDIARVRDIDLVLDLIGGETLERSWATLRAGGRIVSLVAFDIHARSGHDATSLFFTDASPYLPEAVRMFEAGALEVVIDSIFGLDETRAALGKLAAGHARGKIIVNVES